MLSVPVVSFRVVSCLVVVVVVWLAATVVVLEASSREHRSLAVRAELETSHLSFGGCCRCLGGDRYTRSEASIFRW